MAKGNLQRELGVGGGNKYVSLKQEIPILLHQKMPKKIPKTWSLCCLAVVGRSERRLPQVGSAAAGRPVPAGESRTIVTSIGVVGHTGEVVESSVFPPPTRKSVFEGRLSILILSR